MVNGRRIAIFYSAMRIEFDWDPAKAASNLDKHGVSFEDAMAVLSDPLALSRLDDDSAHETRWVTIGMGAARGPSWSCTRTSNWTTV